MSPNVVSDDARVPVSPAKNIASAATKRLPSGFLTLAPTTSTGYPQPKRVSISAAAAPSTVMNALPTSNMTTGAVDVKGRRSSSQSSSGFCFLKLGPVHWGEHLDDHQQDWHAVAVEEV